MQPWSAIDQQISNSFVINTYIQPDNKEVKNMIS